MTIMSQLNYLEAFKRLSLNGEGAYQLLGDCLIVEKIKDKERKVGSIIMADVSNQRNNYQTDLPHFVRVLAVGPGYYDDETGEAIPLEVEAGDIILVGMASVRYFSFFGDLNSSEQNVIGITKATEIQMRFKGQEGYNKAFNLLNGTTQAEVSTASQLEFNFSGGGTQDVSTGLRTSVSS